MGIFSRNRDSQGNVGGWTLSSASDPRWNMGGRSFGMWSAQSDMDKAVAAKKAELGIEPPDDLEMSWMKD